MFEIITALLISMGASAVGYVIGAVAAERRHRRHNAAVASCVACEWTSGPVPLSDAFSAAQRHTATPVDTATATHRGLVVKA